MALVLATQFSSEVKAIHVDHGIREFDAEADFIPNRTITRSDF